MNLYMFTANDQLYELDFSCPAIQNVGVHYETWNTGVVGPVVIHGLDEGSRDLTWQTWSYQVYSAYWQPGAS